LDELAPEEHAQSEATTALDEEGEVNRKAKSFQRLVLNLTALERGVDKMRELFYNTGSTLKSSLSGMDLSTLPGSVQQVQEPVPAQRRVSMRKTLSSQNLTSSSSASSSPARPSLKVSPT
jgi:hypothetical protein